MKRLKSEEDGLGEDRTDQRLKMSPAHTQGLGDSSNFEFLTEIAKRTVKK